MMMDVFQNTETKTLKALICLSVRLTLPAQWHSVHLSLKEKLGGYNYRVESNNQSP